MNVELEALIDFDLSDCDYECSRYYPATFNDPAEGGFEGVSAVWIKLRNRKGDIVEVNVVDLFYEDELNDAVERMIDDQAADGPDGD